MAEERPNSAESRHQLFKSFEAKSLRSRSILTQLADSLTAICGSTPFLVFHILLFSLWISINTGNLPNFKPFDPYPFGFLTMVVSLEAIFLSIFVLVAQNRSSYISTIRDEVHMGVNLVAEEEITKILEILADVRRELGIKKPDPELDKMLERINTSYIERSIAGQVERANKPPLSGFLGLIFYPITASPKPHSPRTDGEGEARFQASAVNLGKAVESLKGKLRTFSPQKLIRKPIELVQSIQTGDKSGNKS